MAERTCADCGSNINGRHWRSIRCADCQLRRERIAMNTKPCTKYTRACGYCGSNFMATHLLGAFCSPRCAGKASHPGNVDRRCVVCDKAFSVSRQYDRPTCSRACANWQRMHPGRKPLRNCRWCSGSLQGKALRAEWCDARCWHAHREGVSWDWIRTRRCVICQSPMPVTLHYHRVVCSAQCRTRNRSSETLFRQAHARRKYMDAATIRRVPKRYIRMLRTLPCFYCGIGGGTADHVVPISRGGLHTEGNLVPACRSCNSSKGKLLLMEWRLRREVSWSQDAKLPPVMPQRQSV